MSRRVVVIAVVLLAGAARAGAQPPVVRLTLADAQERAQANSHRIAELNAREEAVAAAALGRDAADRPTVAFLAGYTRTSHVPEYAVITATGERNVVFPDLPDNFRTRLDMQWPIYTSGRLDALLRAARAERQASAKDVATARADLRLEVSRTYWSLVTAAENARVLQESVKRLDAHLDVVRAQLQAGIVPPNDVLLVEAQRSRQQVASIEAANTRAVIEADLRRLTSLDQGTTIEPVDALSPPAQGPQGRLEPLTTRNLTRSSQVSGSVSDLGRQVQGPDARDVGSTLSGGSAEGAASAVDGSQAQPGAQSLPALIDEARGSRPERQALLERAQAQAARVDAAAAGKKPLIAITGGVDVAHPNQRIVPRRDHTDGTWDVSVNLTWPIWDGGRADAEKAEASALERAARARIAEFDSVLGVEITQRRLDLDAAVASVSAASDGVRSAAEARRVVWERFSAGVATSVDLLDAQVALLQAELDRTRTLANVQIAQARLDRALGR